MSDNFELFLNGYLAAALFSSVDDNDEPLDANYDSDDIDDESLENLTAMARVFYYRNYPYIAALNEEYGLVIGFNVNRFESAGQDLWFTQCGHGVGFWSRDEVFYHNYQEMFNKSAESLGNIDLYVGDDGKIHC